MFFSFLFILFFSIPKKNFETITFHKQGLGSLWEALLAKTPRGPEALPRDNPTPVPTLALVCISLPNKPYLGGAAVSGPDHLHQVRVAIKQVAALWLVEALALPPGKFVKSTTPVRRNRAQHSGP